MEASQPNLNAPPPRPRRVGLYILLGCLGTITIGLFALGFIGYAVFRGETTKTPDRAVLKVRLAGAIPEAVSRDWVMDELFRVGRTLTVKDYLDLFERASTDPKIRGILLEVDPMSIGFAKAEELRDALLRFKKSGKFIVAYSLSMREVDYLVAMAADQVFMAPEGFFELNGFGSAIGHLPGVLEKVGIEVQYYRYGKYKSASGESWGRTNFTPPVREMIEDGIKTVTDHFVKAVAANRGLEDAKVRAAIDRGTFRAESAREAGLIDGIMYVDELDKELATRVKSEKNQTPPYVTTAQYRKSQKPDFSSRTKPAIALVYAQGMIVDGKGGPGRQGSEPLIKSIRRAVEDDRVKAIVLRVDSPGGAGMGCDYVRREVELARAKKPVIVSMSDVAASGGYWVSMDATAIVAHPITATGSIGIFAVVPNMKKLYEKIGYNMDLFKGSPHADQFSGARPFTEEESAYFDKQIFASYQRFVQLAAMGRKMPLEKMEENAQGRTWYGEQALARGLVDKLGGFPAAIALAKEKAGIPDQKEVSVENFQASQNPFEQYFGSDDDTSLLDERLAEMMLRAAGFETSDPVRVAFLREVLERKQVVFPMADPLPLIR